MPLMPMPPMPTKWSGPIVGGSALMPRVPARCGAGSSASASSASRRAASRRPKPQRPLRRLGQPGAVGEEPPEAAGERDRVEIRLRHDPSAAGRGEGPRVRRLVVVGGMRVGNEHRRTADRREFGHGRGAGPANHQMRARQPPRHVDEEAVELGGDAGFGIGRAAAGRSSVRA